MPIISLIRYLALCLLVSGCSYMKQLDVPYDDSYDWQVILVDPQTPRGYKAKVSLCEYSRGVCRMAGTFDAVIGRSGFAELGKKKEGDGHTPMGIYTLERAFGYHPKKEVNIIFPYAQVTKNDIWVDDPRSPQYNMWIKKKPLANSFEKLKRDDDLYEYALVVEYNTEPLIIPGNGSAIFLHVWRGPDAPTAGCVAVSKEDMIKIFRWIDYRKNPRIALGCCFSYLPEK